MNDLFSICEKINHNSESIIDNLDPESIVVYKFIQSEYKKGNISKNHIFQFAFRSFYRLDNAGLTREFKKSYFSIFEETIKKENPNINETLLSLSNIRNFRDQNTVQFSFVTKMFHTIDNSRPIYDNEVISVFGFKQPYNIKDLHKKIEKYNQQYQNICDCYLTIESENLIKSSIEKFHNKFTDHKLSITMVLDFIFWSAGKLINENEKLRKRLNHHNS